MQHLGLIEVKRRRRDKRYNSSRSLISTYSSNQTINNIHTGELIKPNLGNRGNRVTINVSGQLYETFTSTLDKYADTLLGSQSRRLELMEKQSGQIFIDRNRLCFEAVLFFYQSSGNLIRPDGIVMSDFVKECQFYELPENALKRMKHRESFLYSRKKRLPQSHRNNSFVYKCWVFFERPKQFCMPWLSKLYFYFFYLLVILSITLFCMETEMYLHLHKPAQMEKFQLIHGYCEVALNLFFITELSFRFLASPYQKSFFRKPTNCIEFISILVFVFVYGLPDSAHRRNILLFSRILCTFRMTRLGRVSKGIKTSFAVFYESIEDLLAVLFTMVIIVIFGGTVMYYMESNVPKTKFRSIPASMWWAIQTSLCVGYGDIVPQTFIGRYMGMFVLYGGVVVVMVLILSLGGRVFDMYIKEFDETCGGFLPDLKNQKQDYEIHYQDPPPSLSK